VGATVRIRLLLLLAFWLCRTGPAAAQTADVNSVVYPVLAGGGSPAFAAGPIRAMLVADGGPPGSQGFADDSLSGPLFGDNLRVDLGFEYLRPHYSNRATTLVVPPGAAAAFPARASLGDVTHDFAFIPRFGIQYTFADTGLGVGASGKLFTIQGDLRPR
jgi:hypothetical protein